MTTLPAPIKDPLPKWNVYGADISSIAIENAKNLYPECTFFVAGNRIFADKKFDLLFSHHVLEHVHNLSQSFDEMCDYLRPTSSMLHILPCGNEGSFEHSICLLRKDGIDPNMGNRFFVDLDEEGHVRRLTTKQMIDLCMEKGLVLSKQYYSNQYHGAINWVTQQGPRFVQKFTDISSAIDDKAKQKLRRIRNKITLIWAIRYPAVIVKSRLGKINRSMSDYVLLVIGLLFYVFAKPVDYYFNRKATEEWQKRNTESNGSEMYLFFKRQ